MRPACPTIAAFAQCGEVAITASQAAALCGWRVLGHHQSRRADRVAMRVDIDPIESSAVRGLLQ